MWSLLKLFILALITQGLAARSVSLPYNGENRLAELQNVKPALSKAECSESYSPCTCVIDPVYGESVTCANLFDPQVVQDVFSRTLAEEVGSVTIANFLFPSIPADFLSGKRARRIVLRSGSNRITIDPEAFQSTASTTEIFDIVYMSDMTNLKFDFLSNFSQLYSLGMFGNSVGVAASIPSLPPLSGLKELIIVQSDVNLVGGYFPDLSPATLERLWLFSNRFTSLGVEMVLRKILSSTSGSSLTDLVLYDNDLTRLPNEIKLFPRLNNLDVEQNKISGVIAGDLAFASPVERVDLSNNTIGNNFGVGSFEGDFSNAKIFAEKLDMTTLSSEVFQGVLTQMVQPGKEGSIALTFNYFDCDCGLAWLLRDNRNLLSAVENAICSDGLLFQNTSIDQFQDCP